MTHACRLRRRDLRRTLKELTDPGVRVEFPEEGLTFDRSHTLSRQREGIALARPPGVKRSLDDEQASAVFRRA